ncbi:MAG: hypothetical protein ACE5QW_03645 [Thermoplasmata archaeon]
MLRRKYNIRAAAVVGSTAKGKDLEHSHLEIAIIAGGRKPADVHIIYKDIAVSAEFHTDEEVRQDLTVPQCHFVPIANEYSMAHVLHDPEKSVRGLQDDHSPSLGQVLAGGAGTRACDRF